MAFEEIDLVFLWVPGREAFVTKKSKNWLKQVAALKAMLSGEISELAWAVPKFPQLAEHHPGSFLQFASLFLLQRPGHQFYMAIHTPACRLQDTRHELSDMFALGIVEEQSRPQQL
jgi:hypothetical protein